ncbi:hypothetical protein [Siccirubricoccus sp. G192]|uniref:hypothetical protein n=1 Tax=Siccirubricoccus sp. G192 TaxID=2849651 RepID=UPI001C2C3F33|nr:hypothetical protein [Siccirubricoccus sp. G192]MBV1798201.1 hypothetical protein [Siccirubricoccus sp. G192]
MATEKPLLRSPLAGGLQGVQHPDIDTVIVQVLVPQEFDVRGRRAAARRPGIAARGQRLGLGERRLAAREAVPGAHSIGLGMFPPALAQPGLEVGDAIRPRMDVHID